MSFLDHVFGRRAPELANACDPYAGFTDYNFKQVALDTVEPLGLSTNDFGVTAQDCDGAIARIVALRLQYATTKPDRLRNAIMEWFDYYESRAKANKARAEQNARAQQLREILARNTHGED